VYNNTPAASSQGTTTLVVYNNTPAASSRGTTRSACITKPRRPRAAGAAGHTSMRR
jgi:hypothetical protein